MARCVRIRTPMRILEQVVGIIVVLGTLADVFLTVLYARVGRGGLARFGTGIISDRVSTYVWKAFRWVAGRGREPNDDLLSFAAPVIVVLFIAVWITLLALGCAMVVHPMLGSTVRATAGRTPTDFLTAIYVVGESISTAGPTDFTPHTGFARLFIMLDSVIGLSMVTLGLTYLMQVYSALQHRNTLAFKLDAMSGSTGDAAELFAGLGVGGHLDVGYAQLAEIGAEFSAQKEAYQFYPVLFYFRYRQPCYATSRIALLALDTVSLMQGAVTGEHEWIKRTAATKQIWLAAMGLVTTLDSAFIGGGDTSNRRATPDAEALERWRHRFDNAVRRFGEAGIETTTDEEAGFRDYVSLRVRWQAYIDVLADHMAHDITDIDPAGCLPARS